MQSAARRTQRHNNISRCDALNEPPTTQSAARRTQSHNNLLTSTHTPPNPRSNDAVRDAQSAARHTQSHNNILTSTHTPPNPRSNDAVRDATHPKTQQHFNIQPHTPQTLDATTQSEMRRPKGASNDAVSRATHPKTQQHFPQTLEATVLRFRSPGTAQKTQMIENRQVILRRA